MLFKNRLVDATIAPFTNPAGMFGAGFSYAIPETHFELFAEGKSVVYRWDRGGFAPLQLYITTTEGYAYPVAVQTGRFNQTQWDFTYTLGLSFLFKARTQPPALAVTLSDE